MKLYKNSYISITPLKFRKILSQLQSFFYNEVLIILFFLPYKSSKIIYLAIKSLIFELYTKKEIVNLNKILNSVKIFDSQVISGPISKRINFKSRGRSSFIRKRKSHVIIKY